MSMRGRRDAALRAARSAIRAAALTGPGIAVLAAGLGMAGAGPASAAPAEPVACENGVGNVPALVAAVRTGGDIKLRRGCTYRLTERYGTESALPSVTRDTRIDGRGATLSWEGDEIVHSMFEVRAPAQFVVRGLRLRSSSLPIPAVAKAEIGTKVVVSDTSMLHNSAHQARDDAPAPRPITRAGGRSVQAPDPRTPDPQRPPGSGTPKAQSQAPAAGSPQAGQPGETWAALLYGDQIIGMNGKGTAEGTGGRDCGGTTPARPLRGRAAAPVVPVKHQESSAGARSESCSIRFVADSETGSPSLSKVCCGAPS